MTILCTSGLEYFDIILIMMYVEAHSSLYSYYLCFCGSVSGYYFVDLNKRREASYCNSDEEMCSIVVPAANTASVSSKRIHRTFFEEAMLDKNVNVCITRVWVWVRVCWRERESERERERERERESLCVCVCVRAAIFTVNNYEFSFWPFHTIIFFLVDHFHKWKRDNHVFSTFLFSKQISDWITIRRRRWRWCPSHSGVNFTQHFMCSFYMRRSQKCKKDSQLKLLFALLGSICKPKSCE